VEKADITAEVVACLLREQFPDWAALPIRPVDHNGWDNSTYRLGDDMSVRLPSAEMYSAQVEKEHRWLPVLAPQLPLTIPQPLAAGRPGCEFPRPWSVYQWLPGAHASVERVDDLDRFARTLADFLLVLYALDANDGPGADLHNFWRGGPVATFDHHARDAIAKIATDIDAPAALEVWDAALASEWERPPVWIHGDLSASNLLVVDGELSAVIDFGTTGVGDPACDLAIAWTFFDGDDREVFRDRIAMDSATWARGRGWTLWKAAITYEAALRTDPSTANDAGLQFGWRKSAIDVLADVIDDHRRHD
jgi:aminoglycoside phosphotransferase (APT) family kinase protein